MIELFAQNVIDGYPTGVVPWQPLNQCIDEDETEPDKATPALRQQLDLLDRTSQKSYAFPEDLALAQIPDPQGLGGASGLPR